MIIHSAPVWKDRSNCFIFARERDEDGGELEQLLARKIAHKTFQICTIPIFIYNLSLADIVETDDNLEITKVLNRSGRHTIRIKFEREDETLRNEVFRALLSLDVLIEEFTQNYWAIDVVNDELMQKVRSYLISCFDLDMLIFEDGDQL